jgi:4-methyl-5(b-hydroxyethyl)-thiazole monophosphate biosynthesis
MQVSVFLANGFEEMEAITPIDILRRADIKVNTISISDNYEVCGAHGIKIIADYLFDDVDFSKSDLLFLPGGMPGTKNLDGHEGLKNLIINHFNLGKNIAAICAAPSILGKLGILEGKEAICYPGFENQLLGATLSENKVVKSGTIITAQGAGVAVDFALKLVEELKGKLVADKIASSICCNIDR